jgi:hypothetical protein
LAGALDARIKSVSHGGAIEGVNLDLPVLLLPLDQLVVEGVPILGGYHSGADLLRCGICGEENSLVQFAGTALGGFARGVPLGPMIDGEPSPPFVSVAISEFDTNETALAVLATIRKSPNDFPTSIPVPRGERTLVADPGIPGASAALAFHAISDTEDPNATADSAGVDFVIGSRLVSVDVQGGLSVDDAEAAAIDLATQQVKCLSDSGICGSVVVPPSLG